MMTLTRSCRNWYSYIRSYDFEAFRLSVPHKFLTNLVVRVTLLHVTLAIGQDLIIINKKVDYDEIFASYLGEIGSFRDLFSYD